MFKGIESDILPDGSLDYPDEVLERFDFVVASVHSRFRLREARRCSENNPNPWRLDLDWRWHTRALELGCMMSINPDAHSIAESTCCAGASPLARKGGVPKERVLNCLGLRAFINHLANRGSMRRAAVRRSDPAASKRRRRGSQSFSC